MCTPSVFLDLNIYRLIGDRCKSKSRNKLLLTANLEVHKKKEKKSNKP